MVLRREEKGKREKKNVFPSLELEKEGWLAGKRQISKIIKETKRVAETGWWSPQATTTQTVRFWAPSS